MTNAWIWVLAVFGAFYLYQRVQSDRDAMKAGEAKALLDQAKDVQLIDVRTPAEFAEGRIPGARNLPLDRLEQTLGSLKADRPLLVYCRSGRRSQMALGILKSRGFNQARHIGGGILAWQAAGLTVEK